MTTLQTERQLPPIYRDIKRLLVMVEDLVRQFSRYYRYTVGADLRQQAIKLMRLVHRAWRNRAQAHQPVQRLDWALDDFRLPLQLGKELHAFSRLACFAALVVRSERLGRQCGSWLRHGLQRRKVSAIVFPSSSLIASKGSTTP